MTVELAALADRLLLPSAEQPVPTSGGVRGEQLEGRVPALVEVVTTLGRQAADQLNERREATTPQIGREKRQHARPH